MHKFKKSCTRMSTHQVKVNISQGGFWVTHHAYITSYMNCLSPVLLEFLQSNYNKHPVSAGVFSFSAGLLHVVCGALMPPSRLRFSLECLQCGLNNKINQLKIKPKNVLSINIYFLVKKIFGLNLL